MKPSDTEPTGSRRRWLRWMLCAVLLAELGGVWHIVRTDLFLHETVNEQLNRMADRLGGQVTFEAIEPAGLTGVTVRGLEFRRPNTPLSAVRFDEVRVFPAYADLLTGQLSIERVVVPNAWLNVDRPIRELIHRFEDRDLSTSHTIEAGSMLDWFNSQPVGLPNLIVVEHAEVVFNTPNEELADLGLELANIHVELANRDQGAPAITGDGRIQLQDGVAGDFNASWSADGRARLHIALDPETARTYPIPSQVGLSERAHFSFDSITAAWPPELILGGFRATDLNVEIPTSSRWRLDGVQSDRLAFQPSRYGLNIQISGSQIDLMGILDTATLHLDTATIDTDWAMEHPSSTFVFGGPDRGQLSVAISRSSYHRDVVLDIHASSFAVADWAPFIPDELPIELKAGSLTGQATVSASLEGGPTLISIDVQVANGQAYVPPLASRTLSEIDLGVAGELTLFDQPRRLEWHEGTLAFGSESFGFEIDAELDETRTQVSIHLVGDDIGAQALLEALPVGFAPSLEGYEMSGQWSAQLDITLDTDEMEAAQINVKLDYSDVDVLRFGENAPLDQLAGDFLLTRTGSYGDRDPVGPQVDGWVPLEDVPPHLQWALVNAEDTQFWVHDGFDIPAIRTSFFENIQQRRFAQGGSTITQQLVRTLFLNTDRTLGRKLEEAFLTWQMEQLVGKTEIIELYINTVHWGPDIHGIAEASAAYFDHAPSQLTLTESAFLSSILSNPNVFGAQYAGNQLSPSRAEKICNVLLNMRYEGTIPYRDYQTSCLAAREGTISDGPLPVQFASTETKPHFELGLLENSWVW